jgi:hypothetical protein
MRKALLIGKHLLRHSRPPTGWNAADGAGLSDNRTRCAKTSQLRPLMDGSRSHEQMNQKDLRDRMFSRVDTCPRRPVCCVALHSLLGGGAAVFSHGSGKLCPCSLKGHASMSPLTASPTSPRRSAPAPAAPGARDLSIRTRRPSLLDLRFCGDPWVVARDQGPLLLCLGAFPLAHIEGLPLDLPSLNQLLARARCRRPRGQGRHR